MLHVGFMRVFFKKMGIENLRFKPAYNPYTEVRQFHSPMRTRGLNFDRVCLFIFISNCYSHRLKFSRFIRC